MQESHELSPPDAALASLRVETFDPLVGRTARFEGTAFELVLDRVDRMGGVPASVPRAPFTLIFSGPKTHPHMPEGLYRCDFGERAVFEIYIAPVHTPSADRQDYQAAFN